jgi:hypothetical protein
VEGQSKILGNCPIFKATLLKSPYYMTASGYSNSLYTWGKMMPRKKTGGENLVLQSL